MENEVGWGRGDARKYSEILLPDKTPIISKGSTLVEP